MPYTEVHVSWEGKRGDLYEGTAGVLYTNATEESGEVVTMVLVPDSAPNTTEMHQVVRNAFYERRK